MKENFLFFDFYRVFVIFCNCYFFEDSILFFKSVCVLFNVLYLEVNLVFDI